MYLLKYFALVVGLAALLLEKFVKTNKDVDAESKGYTMWGKAIFIVIPVLAFIIALVMSVKEDNDASNEKRIATERHVRDSLQLQHRWEFDTTRLKQILDSSALLITNSNENLKKTSDNYNTSKNLLQLQDDQYRLSTENLKSTNENLKSTKRLAYLLPDSMAYRITLEIDLKDFNSLTRLLDSAYMIDKQQSRLDYNNNLIFSSLQVPDTGFNKITRFCKQMLTPMFDFSGKGLSVITLSADNYSTLFYYELAHHDKNTAYRAVDSAMQAAVDHFIFIYEKDKRKLIVKMPRNLFIPLKSSMRVDRIGLSDLDNSLFSVLLQKSAFDPGIVKVKLVTLKLNEKDILFVADCGNVGSGQLPKNYDQVKNDFAVYQNYFSLFSEQSNISMSFYLEENYSRGD